MQSKVVVQKLKNNWILTSQGVEKIYSLNQLFVFFLKVANKRMKEKPLKGQGSSFLKKKELKKIFTYQKIKEGRSKSLKKIKNFIIAMKQAHEFINVKTGMINSNKDCQLFLESRNNFKPSDFFGKDEKQSVQNLISLKLGSKEEQQQFFDGFKSQTYDQSETNSWGKSIFKQMRQLKPNHLSSEDQNKSLRCCQIEKIKKIQGRKQDIRDVLIFNTTKLYPERLDSLERFEFKKIVCCLINQGGGVVFLGKAFGEDEERLCKTKISNRQNSQLQKEVEKKIRAEIDSQIYPKCQISFNYVDFQASGGSRIACLNVSPKFVNQLHFLRSKKVVNNKKDKVLDKFMLEQAYIFDQKRVPCLPEIQKLYQLHQQFAKIRDPDKIINKCQNQCCKLGSEQRNKILQKVKKRPIQYERKLREADFRAHKYCFLISIGSSVKRNIIEEIEDRLRDRQIDYELIEPYPEYLRDSSRQIFYFSASVSFRVIENCLTIVSEKNEKLLYPVVIVTRYVEIDYRFENYEETLTFLENSLKYKFKGIQWEEVRSEYSFKVVYKFDQIRHAVFAYIVLVNSFINPRFIRQKAFEDYEEEEEIKEKYKLMQKKVQYVEKLP